MLNHNIVLMWSRPHFTRIIRSRYHRSRWAYVLAALCGDVEANHGLAIGAAANLGPAVGASTNPEPAIATAANPGPVITSAFVRGK